MRSDGWKEQLRVFVRELKRREVFQTAGLYAVGAFLATEIALAFIDRSPLSESTNALASCILVTLFVGGFPIVLWLAWLFDLTRHGIFKEGAWAHGRYGTAASAMAAAIVVTGLTLWMLNPCGVGRVIGIAVLPCSYHGPPEYDDQATGISAELNYRLSHLPRLRVPANSSVVDYSGRLVNPDDLAHELGVEWLVECAARKTDSRITFNLGLFSPDDDENRWTDEFDGQAVDELFLISEAFRALIGVDAMNAAALAGARIEQINRLPTPSNEAWRLFQQARRAELSDDLDLALSRYGKAATVDPAFARAHTSAARLLWLTTLGATAGQPDIAATLDAARAHTRRALQEPYSCAEALVMRRLLLDSDEDPETLHAEIISRRPSYAEEYLFWSAWLRQADRPVEAEAALASARELDPSGILRERYRGILPAPE
ncbi:MAG: hypothetical protein WBM57_13720 [Woeseiaceae bacterium]